jgi:hypothetical protein
MRHAPVLAAAVAVLASTLVLEGCERASAAGRPSNTLSTPATQYIVGIDISGSRTRSQLLEEQTVVDGLIARMQFGDRIVLVETYRTGLDSAGQWQDSIPLPRIAGKVTGRDRRNLERFRVTAPQVASTFFDPSRSKQVMSTDLFHTLARAADYAKAANKRTTIVILLSDMLQATAEVNMERANGIPPDTWTDDLKAQGRLPDLKNVCVYVVGADPTSQRGARVRSFWKHYFESTGATFPLGNYRNMVADPAQIRCD